MYLLILAMNFINLCENSPALAIIFLLPSFSLLLRFTDDFFDPDIGATIGKRCCRVRRNHNFSPPNFNFQNLMISESGEWL